MNESPQPYCQLQTMSNLLMQIEGSKPVVLRFDDHRYHPIGLTVDGMDYLTILFERNGLNGVAYDVDGYRGSRTWRTANCYSDGDYEFRQRTEEELCDEVAKEVIKTRINCKWIPLATNTNQHQPKIL